MDPTNLDRPGRPVGITILAILFMAGGVGLLVVGALMVAWLLTADGELDRVLGVLGANHITLVLGFGLLAGLGLAGGVGMLHGASWGWWIGSFYCVYTIARNVMAALALPGLAGSAVALGEPEPDLTKHYVKFLGRVAINLLLVVYFFRPKVLAYFDLEGMSKVKALGVQALVCLFLVGGFIALSVL